MPARKPDGNLKRGWTTGACATAVIKDAGDDPDVTHGAEVSVTLRIGVDGSGVTFRAGPGVGTVTLPGLPLPPGEPAINPGPRKMMTGVIQDLSCRLNGPGDVEITVAIKDGEVLAEKTMNGRLGILGGLSDLPDMALIDMGDFAGGLLKYLRRHPLQRLTLAGGFGKLAKLAQGHLDLHSARSSLDLKKLAALAGDDRELADRIAAANTGMEALTLAQAAGVPLADRVAAGAREVALAALAGDVAVEVLVYDRQGQLAGRAGG